MVRLLILRPAGATHSLRGTWGVAVTVTTPDREAGGAGGGGMDAHRAVGGGGERIEASRDAKEFWGLHRFCARSRTHSFSEYDRVAEVLVYQSNQWRIGLVNKAYLPVWSI